MQDAPVDDLASGNAEQSMRDLSDQQVLEAVNSQMPPDQDERLSELLYLQQARLLNPAERGELAELMRCYGTGLLRKARALREAVERGLMAPLEP